MGGQLHHRRQSSIQNCPRKEQTLHRTKELSYSRQGFAGRKSSPLSYRRCQALVKTPPERQGFEQDNGAAVTVDKYDCRNRCQRVEREKTFWKHPEQNRVSSAVWYRLIELCEEEGNLSPNTNGSRSISFPSYKEQYSYLLIGTFTHRS